MELPVIVSPTRVELASRCRRRHLLSDLLHLRGTMSSPSAAFGTQIHSAAAAWWEGLRDGRPAPERYEAALHAGLDQWPEAATYKYHTEALARTLIERYTEEAVASANALDDGWEIVEVERRLVRELVENGWVSFQIDRLLKKDDRLLVVDTKTSARPDARWAAGMRVSLQQRQYLLNIAMEHDVDPMDVQCWIEGIDKKQSPGAIRYEHVSEFWTEGFLAEAEIAAVSTINEDLSVVEACTSIAEQLPGMDTRTAMLTYALTAESFNLQDCNSYFTPCAFTELCHEPDVEARIPLAEQMQVGDENGEGWDAESRELVEEALRVRGG